MSKISQYAQDTSPTTDDYLIGVDASGPTTKRYVLSDLITLVLNNIPATEGSFAFVSSGLVWTADAVGSTRAASMTLGRIRVNTTFLSIAAVTARIFTASKDTYIDILDNLNGTGTLVYTEVTNNAASPALAANSVRIGIIVTGATTIATTGSINQGQEDRVLPIASSVAYSVTDSLGNLICPRDSNRKLLGYRQITANVSTSAVSAAQITGLSCPVIIPTGRKIKITISGPYITNPGVTNNYTTIWEGTVGSGTQLQAQNAPETTTTSAQMPQNTFAVRTPSSTSLTYNCGGHTSTGTVTFNAASTSPMFIMVELE